MDTEKILVALVRSIDVALFISRQLCEKVKPNTQAEMIARLIRKILNDAATAAELGINNMSRQNIDLKLKSSDMYGKNVYD